MSNVQHENTESIQVLASDGDLLKYGKCTAIEALEELIWNAYDAGASHATITTRYKDDANLALDEVLIADDGPGFEVDARTAFGEFGSSIKKDRLLSPTGRIEHGREGKGRYRALALGEQIEWVSRSKRDGGQFSAETVLLTRANPNKAELRRETSAGDSTGVLVRIVDPTDWCSTLFATDVGSALAVRFAPRLLADSAFSITVNGQAVNIESFIAEQQTKSVVAKDGEREVTGTLTVCVWNANDPTNDEFNKIHLCSESGSPVRVVKSHVFARGITYSAIIRSSYFNPGQYTGLGSDDDSEPGLDVLEDSFAREARSLVNEINRNSVAQAAASAVEQMKAEDIYPYEDEPQTEVEIVERQVFSVLAQEYFELHPLAPNKPKEKKKALAQALKAVVGSDDEALQVILEHVLELKPDEQEQLRKVLERVRLPDLTKFAQTVIDRLDFVAALELLLFDKDLKKDFKERAHLQKMLSPNLWIFGEEYNMGSDDQSLKNVLIRHREILELDEQSFDESVDRSGLTDIPDLMLFKQIPVALGNFEFLVVELKAPTVRLGEKEFSQIKKYARTVAGDEQFNGSWTFLLVGNDVQEEIYKQEACQQNRPSGLILDSGNHKVWVRRWNEVLQDAKARHQWLREKLKTKISNATSREYIATNHADHAPQLHVPDEK